MVYVCLTDCVMLGQLGLLEYCR